jgi:hypothetical protein
LAAVAPTVNAVAVKIAAAKRLVCVKRCMFPPVIALVFKGLRCMAEAFFLRGRLR